MFCAIPVFFSVLISFVAGNHFLSVRLRDSNENQPVRAAGTVSRHVTSLSRGVVPHLQSLLSLLLLLACESSQTYHLKT